MLLMLLASYALPCALAWMGQGSAATGLLREDGLYEWAGALACLVGACLFFAARRGAWGLLLLAVFAEELSWGRRLFHFGVPVWFVRHNYQRDVTFHNLNLLGAQNNAGSNLGLNLLQMYLLALPLLLAAFPWLGARVRRLGLPVPSLAVAFLAGMLKYLNREAMERFGLPDGPTGRLGMGEVFETGLELLLLVVAIESWLAARSVRGAPIASERVPAGR